MATKVQRKHDSPGMRVSGPFPPVDGMDASSQLKLVLAHDVEDLLAQAEAFCRPISESAGACLATDEETVLTNTLLSVLPEMSEAIDATGKLPPQTAFLVGGKKAGRDCLEYYADKVWVEAVNARREFKENAPRRAAYSCFLAGFYYAAAQFAQYDGHVRREQSADETRRSNTKAVQASAEHRKQTAIAEMVRRLQKNPKLRPKSVAQEMAKETKVDRDGNTVPKWTVKPGKAISVRTLEAYYTEFKRFSAK